MSLGTPPTGDQFLLQPNLYSTGEAEDLFGVLDGLWADRGDHDPQEAAYFLVSGFATHNGGVRFFERFRHHIDGGGTVHAVFGGSRSSNMTSRQLVDALVECGASVHIINRRYMMHSKLYGKRSTTGDEHLVVTSGNFSAPGLRRNIESLISLSGPSTAALGFDWSSLIDGLLSETGNVFAASEAAVDDPRWALLYDEETRGRRRATAEDQESDVLESLIVTLSHFDTARVMADRGTRESMGTQYFLLSKDSFDFFPALTERRVSNKGLVTYSTMVDVNFVNITTTKSVRVTFEAENNSDFRLGTGPLRCTQVASKDDIAVLSRRGEAQYDLRIVHHGAPEFVKLNSYAITHVGARGKRYGYAPNAKVDEILSR